MKSERLNLMRRDAVAIDSETHLIQPGLLAPPLVLGSYAYTAADKTVRSETISKGDYRSLFRDLLADRRYTIVVANGPYDFLVAAVDAAQNGEDLMPAIFNLYDPEGTIVRGFCDGRVFDVQRAEELDAIAGGHLGKHRLTGKPLADPITGKPGRYSLNMVTYEVTGRADAKANDRFRLRYAEFDGVPIAELPYEARVYPADDTANTLEAGLGQAGALPSVHPHAWVSAPDGAGGTTMGCAKCQMPMSADAPLACMRAEPRKNLHDLARQCYAAWALHLSDSWGFNIDQDAVNDLEKKFVESRESQIGPFVAAGVIRKDGSENQNVMKKLVAQAYGAKDGCYPCQGAGKVPSPATDGKTKINCPDCNGSGLHLTPEVPRTDKGGIKTDRDTLQESGDDFLMAKKELDEGEKTITTYIPLMRRGRVCIACNQHGTKKSPHANGCPVHNGAFPEYRKVPFNPRSNTLVETGRCSYSDGIHGLPRKGGIRECFVARPGYVLSSEDFTAGELVMVAQLCIWKVGYSKLAEALNLGLDAHLALAGTLLGKGYPEMVAAKKAGDKLADIFRQAAKNANFGFWGGMAELTFVLRKRSEPGLFTPCAGGPDEHDGVRGYNGFRPCIVMSNAERCGIVKITSYNDNPCSPVCKACVEAAKRLREFWFRQWPEASKKDGYFKWVSEELDATGGVMEQLGSKRLRGGVGFCDGANGGFQGMLADVMKNAYCQIQRECYDRTWRVRSSEHMTSKYDGGPSPLYGSRGQLLAHDEFIGEHPESVAHDAAHRVSEIMVEAERFMCPDLAPACKADPALMRKLYKGAEGVFVDGKLVPWEPKKKAS